MAVFNNNGLTLAQRLFGVQAPDVDTIDISGINVNSPEFAENAPDMAVVRVGNPANMDGLLNDMNNGFKENYTTGFAVNNLQPDENKGWATKIGEGLGTVARFADSPLGRGLIAGGLNAALGYNNSLQEGLTAMVGRQQNKAANDLYRQQLASQGINTDNIGGNITDNMYKQMLAAKQLQDNAEYRQMYYDTMLQRQADELEYKRQKDEADRLAKEEERRERREDNAANRAVTMRGQDLSYQSQMEKNNTKTNANDLAEVETQLKNFEAMFDKVPNKLRGATEGIARRAVGLASTNEAKFDAQRTLLFNTIARKLGGEKGVLSDQDIKRIEKALPTLSDSYEQRQAKMRAVYELLDIKKGSTAKADPLGIR